MTKKKEPKFTENVKKLLVIRGTTSSKLSNDVMGTLAMFKKPYVKQFKKKNLLKPFEDISSFEFFSEVNDTSFIIFSSNSKKRSNSLTFCRFFDYKLYDMFELFIQDNYKSLNDFKKFTFSLGLRPMFTFNGSIFESNAVFKQMKSFFLDLFKGEDSALQDVLGLQYVISFSAAELDDIKQTDLPLLHFRVYKLKTFKTSSRLPRVELEEIGPRIDFKIGRRVSPLPELEKMAFKKAKNLEPKVKKNIKTDYDGDMVAQIHVGQQNLDKLQTRKMKGLKTKHKNDFSTDSKTKKARNI